VEIRTAYAESRSVGLEFASVVPSLRFYVVFHIFLNHRGIENRELLLKCAAGTAWGRFK